ncbi:DUF397 domain-containing protein [Streptomyces albofaciens JCM 4342]|uniref:DUF397 domain-containing protein n=1 Tax=Streptomyces albofaciens TaxID=66866 RepID=UPI00123B4A1D|nr:DUF397 domain-containing protein [Streptomyces albofaciens]KAA6220613.1 DUF397 domain-containing protein [Streptomyces albofaciens JCM 4342]KAA6220656.1 DUF397 domain-containing protein [Streptomyces albofaciens JCM 4342]
MDSKLIWQKSSFSGGGGEQCVEIAEATGSIFLRESDDPNVIATLTRDNLGALIRHVKLGALDHRAH